MLDNLEVSAEALLRLDNFDLFLSLASMVLVDVNDSAKAGTLVHGVHKFVDFVEAIECVGHVVLDGKLSQKDLVYELRDVLARFPASKSSAFPDPPSD